MKRKWTIVRRQKAIRGGRRALPSTTLHAIADKVEAEAAKWGVSKSFVVAVALAHVFGIKEQETYVDGEGRQRLRRVK